MLRKFHLLEARGSITRGTNGGSAAGRRLLISALVRETSPLVRWRVLVDGSLGGFGPVSAHDPSVAFGTPCAC